MYDWLRLTARHWFLLPPASLLIAVTLLLYLAFQESEPPPGPRQVRRWSEPIQEYRATPARWSAQTMPDTNTEPMTVDPSGDPPQPFSPDSDQ